MASRLYALVAFASLAVFFPDSGDADRPPAPRPAPESSAAPAREQPVAAARPPQPAPSAIDPERLVRLYDFSPASQDNPVVARISGTGPEFPMDIPVSEFRAYLKAEVSEDERKTLDRAGTKRHLERLIDDLLFLQDAYRRHVDTSERFTRSMESTRRLLLVEFLTREDVGDKAKSADHYAVLQSALEDRLFEKAEVHVSNEAYAELKQAVVQYGSGKAALSVGSGKPDAPSLPTEIAAHPLAHCTSGTPGAPADGEMKVSVGEAFTMYVGMPEGKRPNIGTQEGVSKLLKQFFMDDLKIAEARARGIDKTRDYRDTVAANRASLTRMWLQDRITAKAAQRMKAPETEARLRQWYDDNRQARYTYKDDKGVQKVMSFETEKPSIRNDYFDTVRETVRAERAAQLREGLKIEIDESKASIH